MIYLGLFCILSLIISSCKTHDPFQGKWILHNINIAINNDFDYLEESQPGFIQERLLKILPEPVSNGGLIEFSKKENIIFNKTDTFNYRFGDPYLFIRESDMVYTLEYKVNSDTLMLMNKRDLGEAIWIFKKLKKEL